jgi:hypothetical protein
MNTSLEFFKSLIERDTKVMEMLLKDNTPSGPTTTNSIIEDLKGTIGTNGKPYSNIKFVNDVLTVVLHDGSIISKHPASVDDFKRARNSRTETELFAICMVKEVYEDKVKKEQEIEKMKALAEGAKKLAAFPDYFELKDGSVYVKGISRSLPPLLVEEFLVVLSKHNPLVSLDYNDNFTALYNFWMWCCLNPRAEVADKLFNFLKNNSFKITKQGFFTALRNVVTIHGGTEFVQFVSEAYNKVKAIWKKSPDNYHVFLKDGQYSILHKDDMYEEYSEEWDDYCSECNGDECEYCDWTGMEYNEESGTRLIAGLGEDLGTLTELYLDLPNREENRFTDAHTRTFDIRIGQVVHMDPDKCRWNTDDCGAEGLHFTSDELLHDLDFDTIGLDEEFTVKEMYGLKEKVVDGFTAEAKKYSVNFPTVSIEEVDSIVSNLNRMQYIIANRVSKI